MTPLAKPMNCYETEAGQIDICIDRETRTGIASLCPGRIVAVASCHRHWANSCCDAVWFRVSAGVASATSDYMPAERQ